LDNFSKIKFPTYPLRRTNARPKLYRGQGACSRKMANAKETFKPGWGEREILKSTSASRVDRERNIRQKKK